MSLRYLTMNQMSEITGIDRRTVKKRVAHLKVHKGAGKGHYYDAHEALPALYHGEGGGNIDQKLQAEQLKYDAARAELKQLEVAKLRGQVVPVEDVAKVVEKEYSFVRQQIRALPSKLAMPLALVSDPNQIHEMLQHSVDECLTELTADVKYEQQRIDTELALSVGDETDEEPSDDAEAASEAESSGVVGHTPISESRE